MYLSEAQEAVLTYWLKACPEELDRFPGRSQINPADLGRHMAHVVILDVLNDPRDFQFRLIGTHVREFMFDEETGMKFSELKDKGPKSKLWSIKEETVRQRAPVFQEVPYIGPRPYCSKVTTLQLPLATDHVTIDKILSVPHFIPNSDAPNMPVPRRLWTSGGLMEKGH